MNNSRTHLADKAWHVGDLETGAIVAVALYGANTGDTRTMVKAAIAPAEQVEETQAQAGVSTKLQAIVADTVYHANEIIVELHTIPTRPCVWRLERSRRDWSRHPVAQPPMCADRRRIRGRAPPGADAPTR